MNLRLIRGQFEDPKVTEDLYKATKDLSIIHFDLDLGFLLNNALKIIEPYLKNRKDPIFFYLTIGAATQIKFLMYFLIG